MRDRRRVGHSCPSARTKWRHGSPRRPPNQHETEAFRRGTILETFEMENGIRLSVNRRGTSEDAWRIERLRRVVRRLAPLAQRPVALHDHKGQLVCLWLGSRYDLPCILRVALAVAWSLEGEPGSTVTHYFVGERGATQGPWEEPHGPDVDELELFSVEVSIARTSSS